MKDIIVDFEKLAKLTEEEKAVIGEMVADSLYTAMLGDFDEEKSSAIMATVTTALAYADCLNAFTRARMEEFSAEQDGFGKLGEDWTS